MEDRMFDDMEKEIRELSHMAWEAAKGKKITQAEATETIAHLDVMAGDLVEVTVTVATIKRQLHAIRSKLALRLES
jgi:hypothetical protein